jgi:hypothetical protein
MAVRVLISAHGWNLARGFADTMPSDTNAVVVWTEMSRPRNIETPVTNVSPVGVALFSGL